MDYYENENNGCLEVVVIRYGMLSEDVVLAVHPMTYQQFNHSLPDLPHLPDPAECKRDLKLHTATITVMCKQTPLCIYKQMRMGDKTLVWQLRELLCSQT